MATKLTRKSTVEWVATGKAVGLTTAIASAAYPVSNLTFDTYVSDVVEGAGYVGSYSRGKNHYGGEYTHISFTMPLVGQSSVRIPAKTPFPPYWGALFRACGFDETMAGAGNGGAAVYTQGDIHNLAAGTTGLWPIDIKCNVDGRLKTVKNAVGTVSIDLSPGSIGLLHFEFWGQRDILSNATDTESQAALTLYKEPTQVGLYAGVLTRIAAGSAAAAVTGLTLGNITLNAGNNVEMGKDANGILGYGVPGISDRDPIYTVTIEDPGIAVINFESDWRYGVRYDFALTHAVGMGVRQECGIVFGGFMTGMPVYREGKLSATIELRQSTETIGSANVVSVPLTFTFASLSS